MWDITFKIYFELFKYFFFSKIALLLKSMPYSNNNIYIFDIPINKHSLKEFCSVVKMLKIIYQLKEFYKRKISKPVHYCNKNTSLL